METIYLYDELDRITETQYDNKIKSILYDDGNNKTTLIDEKGNLIIFIYDVYGRIDEVYKTVNKGETDERNIATNFEYDNCGRIQWAIAPKGNATKYEYDYLYRVTAIYYVDAYVEGMTVTGSTPNVKLIYDDVTNAEKNRIYL